MMKLLRRSLLLSVALFVLGLLPAACRESPPTSTARPPTTAGSDPGVVHVHGLGINPKDGALYAATHTGLFRIPEQGRAARIADRFQDTMGFTVVGPDRFLGSGHPDIRDHRAGRLPPLLGLIESTDAGRTWQPRSLLGQADFHGLRAVHGRIYGFDSTGGAFLVSSDGTSWETRAKALMRDFAVSPADPDLIIGAMSTDVQRSPDGGRTWAPLRAPPLVLLAWDEPSALWGLTAAGALFTSNDAGTSWYERGALGGAPEAFLAHNGQLYASVHQGGIFVSEDGGATWRLRYRDGA